MLLEGASYRGHIERETHAIRLAELPKDFRQVCFDRRNRDIQCLGDLFVACTLSEESEDLTLAKCHAFELVLRDGMFTWRDIADGGVEFFEQRADGFPSSPNLSLLHLVDHLEEHIGSYGTGVALRATP